MKLTKKELKYYKDEAERALSTLGAYTVNEMAIEDNGTLLVKGVKGLGDKTEEFIAVRFVSPLYHTIWWTPLKFQKV